MISWPCPSGRAVKRIGIGMRSNQRQNETR